MSRRYCPVVGASSYTLRARFLKLRFPLFEPHLLSPEPPADMIPSELIPRLKLLPVEPSHSFVGPETSLVLSVTNIAPVLSIRIEEAGAG